MAEAAAYSGLSAPHLRLLARSGNLKAWRLGRDWFTTRQAVERYLRDEARRRKGPRTGEHSAATLLLHQGVHPKIVAEMLGHMRIGTTLDLYSHVTPTMQREATLAMEALLSSGAPP